MSNGRGFLTGLTQGLSSGVSSRQKEERDLANSIMGIMLKAKMEKEFQDPLEKRKKELDIEKSEVELKDIASGKYTKDTLDKATTLRKEFNADQIKKDYQTINRSATAMKDAFSLSTQGDNKSRIASDQALGVVFQKMLDPDSVVRESEYARTPEGASLVNRLRSVAPQLQKGGLRLGDEDRAALVEMGNKLLEGATTNLKKHIDRYSKLAQQYNVPSELVVSGVLDFNVGDYTSRQTDFSQMSTDDLREELRRLQGGK